MSDHGEQRSDDSAPAIGLTIGDRPWQNAARPSTSISTSISTTPPAARQETSLGMNINRQTRRRASGLGAAALLAVTLGAVAPHSRGDALGPVTAITPREVIPNGFVGAVFNPSL